MTCVNPPVRKKNKEVTHVESRKWCSFTEHVRGKCISTRKHNARRHGVETIGRIAEPYWKRRRQRAAHPQRGELLCIRISARLQNAHGHVEQENRSRPYQECIYMSVQFLNAHRHWDNKENSEICSRTRNADPRQCVSNESAYTAYACMSSCQ